MYVHVVERHYGFSREQVVTMLRHIAASAKVTFRKEVVLAAAKCYRTHSKLSFTDCYLAESARDEGCFPLWTFDKKLARQHEVAREVSSR